MTQKGAHKTAYFHRVCPRCKKQVPVGSPVGVTCPACHSNIGSPSPHELIPTAWGKAVFDVFGVNPKSLTEKAVEIVKEKAKDTEHDWIIDLLSPLVDVATEILPTLTEKGFTKGKPQRIEDIMTPHDFTYAKMGIPTNEWGTPAGATLSHAGVFKYTGNIQIQNVEESTEMIPQKTIQVEEKPEIEVAQQEVGDEKIIDVEQVDLNLIQIYLRDLTPDVAASYISDNFDLQILLKPYINRLTRKQKLVIRATSFTALKLFLKKEKRNDLVEIISTDEGKTWVKENLTRIKKSLKDKKKKKTKTKQK